jgi:hypothetical protein
MIRTIVQGDFSMKKVILITVLAALTLLTTAITVTAQEGNTGISDELGTRYFMEDSHVFRYFCTHIGRDGLLAHLNDLIMYYDEVEDVEVKQYIIYALRKALDNYLVFELVLNAIHEGEYVSVSTNPDYHARAWEVRLMAINAVTLAFRDPEVPVTLLQKEELSLNLVQTLRYDPEERVRGAAALAIAELIAPSENAEGETSAFIELNEDPNFNPGARDHNVRSLQYYLDLLHDIYEGIPREQPYFMFSMTRALGQIAHPTSFWYLMQARRRGFDDGIKREIFKSLQRVSNTMAQGGGGISQN